ncbi:MAG: RrF2 family transcriptional regulator [Chitinispirillaceae bacterium]
MKLSTKCRYGLRAVLQIAEAGDRPSKRRDIAAEQNLSDSYLENILIMLKSEGIISTTRGVKGGYVLGRDPSSITLLEIVTALEGPLDLVDCVGDSKVCGKSLDCVARSVWQELSASWNKTLGGITLKDLLERKKRNEPCTPST